MTRSPITISPYTYIGMRWGIKINTSIYSIACWFVLALEKQCSNKAAFSSRANRPKAAAPSLGRQVVHMASPAPGSACTHNTAAVAFQISSALMMPEKEKPNCFRSEAGFASILLPSWSSEQRGDRFSTTSSVPLESTRNTCSLAE